MFKKFFHDYIFKLFVAVAVTSTVAIFALINRLWTWPNAVVGGVLLLCGIFFLMDRLGIGPSLKSRVRDWLDSSGYSIKTIQDSNEFHFVMTDNIGIVTDIIQPSPHSSIIIVSANHKATPEQLAVFNSKTESEQRAFWKNVRLELLRYGLSFSDLSLDGDGVALSENVVPSGSLNATEFLKRLLFVRSAVRLYWELLGNLYDYAQPSRTMHSVVPQGPTHDAKSPLPSPE